MTKKPRVKKPSSVRKIDVTITELREIASALDEFAISADESGDSALLSVATRIRATRARIAPYDEFPRRDGESLVEKAFNRGYALGRDEGAATGGTP